MLRRNIPIARITPIEDAPTPAGGYGWMAGSVEELGDIIGPTGDVWNLGDEDVA